MTSTKKNLLQLGVIILFAACQTTPALRLKSVAAEIVLPAILMLANYPLSLTDRPTTAAATTMAHLEGRLSQPINTPEQTLAQAGLLYQRYQIIGRVSDLDALMLVQNPWRATKMQLMIRFYFGPRLRPTCTNSLNPKMRWLSFPQRAKRLNQRC